MYDRCCKLYPYYCIVHHYSHTSSVHITCVNTAHRSVAMYVFLFKDCLQNVIQVDTQVTFNSPNHNPSDVLSSNTTTNMIAAATISAATTSTSTITSATVTTSSAVLSSATMSSSTSPVQPVSSENCKDTEIVCLLYLTEMMVALEYQFSCCHAYIQCIS